MVKRERRKMTTHEIFESKQYRSIIFLTLRCDKGDGLRQLHYRWALMKDHGGINQTSFVKEMKTFFPDKKEIYDVLGSIVKDCITSKTNLSNFLNRLISEPYQLLKKIEDENVNKYHVTEKGLLESQKWLVFHALHFEKAPLPSEIIDELNNIITKYYSDKMLDDLNFDKEDMMSFDCRGFC